MGAADGGKAELHKFRLYLQQIPPGMANLHRTAVFVSEITALTRKLTQYRAQKRKLKIVKVFEFNSILLITQRDFVIMSSRNSIFRYSRSKNPLFKNERNLFHGGWLCDPHYTALTQAGDGFAMHPLMICKA